MFVVVPVLRWRLFPLDLLLVSALVALVAWPRVGTVAAVALPQTTRRLVGTQASTSEFPSITATHLGAAQAALADSGPAAGGIAPGATDASVAFRLEPLAVGDFVYRIRFASTSAGDDIPAGTVHARWTVAGLQHTASLGVAGTSVAPGASGGFTIMLPGDGDTMPKDIRVVYEHA